MEKLFNPFGIITFNMHGFNTSNIYLKDLCNNSDVNIIAVQEHWLSPSHLHLLNDIHPEFVGYGISAMSNQIISGVFRGRPFGGVAFLWRRSINDLVTVLCNDDAGRGLCILLKGLGNKTIKLINVYFPCFSSGTDYRDELDCCLGFINSAVNPGDDLLLMGDFNFKCDITHVGYKRCLSLFKEIHLCDCDDLCNIGDGYTYFNAALGHGSFIDHFFCTPELRALITSIHVEDNGANLSDHRPIWAKFDFDSLFAAAVNIGVDTGVQDRPDRVPRAWRWDKANLDLYYEATRVALSTIPPPSVCITCHPGCRSVAHYNCINNYYNDLVHALHIASDDTIPRIKGGCLKPFWNEELERLKSDSIFWHSLWVNADRPMQGALYHVKRSTNMRYKLGIRDAYRIYEDSHNDDINANWLSKNPQEFWKAWHCKFSKRISSRIVFADCKSDADIANKFVSHFSGVYYNSYSDGAAVVEFEDEYLKHSEDYDLLSYISVAQIEESIRKLKPHKAAGPDELMAEHLIYAHPSLVVHLKFLFSLIISHSFVPDAFGTGIIIPLVKDKSNSINCVTNYRPITLTPIISKLLESLLFIICQEELVTDELQLGFKQQVGCSDALFCVRTVVNHFIENGSSICAASLDLSKAFDSINHFKLYSSLLRAGIPLVVIDIIKCWYSKLSVRIRWNNVFSSVIAVASGVRQGSLLSPYLFNLFINILICDLKRLDIGCHIDKTFYGCFLYADDIFVLSPSLIGLQVMLDRCTLTCNSLSLNFNASKSYCIYFGAYRASMLPLLTLSGKDIAWCSKLRYLGAFIVSGKRLTFAYDNSKRNFYASFNNIISQAKTLDQLVQLSLLESYCLPLLTYSIGALSLSPSQLNELNVCWNSAFRSVFHFNRWESVKGFMCGLGRLNLINIVKVRRIKYYFKLIHCNDYNTVLYNLFFVSLTQLSCRDDILKFIFGNISSAVEYVHQQFCLEVGHSV